VAVDAEGIVAGLVQGSALDAHPGYTIEQAMEFGVTTVRPSEKLGPLRERLKSAGVEGIVVPNSDGRFLGLLLCDDSADGTTLVGVHRLEDRIQQAVAEPPVGQH
jgi:hypothetical protein